MSQKVILFGHVPLAKKVLWHLTGLDKTEILGVVTVDRPMPEWRSTSSQTPVPDACSELGIPIIEHDEVLDLNPDIGFTVRYPQILSEKMLDKFDKGVVNFHGGHLPEYRGAHAANHVLINGEDWHGATLHLCDPGIDTGPIIDRKKFPIKEKDTAYTLYQKAKIQLWKMYVNDIEDILMGRIDPIPQREIKTEKEPKTYKRTDIEGKKKIDVDADSSKKLQVIRAFDFPTHDPAFTIINGEKIELRTGWNDLWPRENLSKKESCGLEASENSRGNNHSTYYKVKEYQKDHFENLYEEHKGTPYAVASESEAHKELRYSVISNLLPKNEDFSIYEVGYGLGHFYEYLNDNFNINKINYAGSEIVEEYYEYCKRNYPDSAKFELRDIIKNPPSKNYDYIIMSGVFHQIAEASREEWKEYMYKIINKTFKYSQKAIAFNFLSEFVDYKKEGNFYCEIEDLIEFINNNLSRFFKLRHDYALFEGTVFVYQPDFVESKFSKEEFKKYF